MNLHETREKPLDNPSEQRDSVRMSNKNIILQLLILPNLENINFVIDKFRIFVISKERNFL